MLFFFFYGYGYHLNLHVLTLSFPTRRSSDLLPDLSDAGPAGRAERQGRRQGRDRPAARRDRGDEDGKYPARAEGGRGEERVRRAGRKPAGRRDHPGTGLVRAIWARSEEHTSELQSLLRNSYAAFGLKKKTTDSQKNKHK